MFIASMTPLERERPSRNEVHYSTSTDFKRFRNLADGTMEAPTKKAYN